ncbi:ADP-heptose synthase [Paenibacillus sp. HN-1]|uniref:ADP-heptose synthase n=1 Tax=Paenibacillus TaxID=44249 RepID=UPI001CA821A3|nr:MULTISPECIES: ADP-heptose synthase [Paenibacillus]MBY9082000.1 ADP-heptose synthase [Paenibacillus sp. CGMCC 1.18879]MBY9085842.1 ADP-heptose synthase [Paenibacillus sinensis]
MSRQFMTEAVMMAIYGQLLVPGSSVEYIVPYTTILELYELRDSDEPLMNIPDEDRHVKVKIGELIAYFEEPLNQKKIRRCLTVPWAKSPAIVLGEQARVTVINSVDNASYGETFDPIETELLLASQREKIPILTDQIELIHRIIDGGVPVTVYDIDDFEFAMEEETFRSSH